MIQAFPHCEACGSPMVYHLQTDSAYCPNRLKHAKTQCQPMFDRILVQRIEEPETSRIVIPDIAKGQAHIGIILAVGPGRRIEGIRIPMESKVGDKVAFGRFTDWEFEKRNPWGTPAGSCLIQEADIMFKITEPVKIGIDAFVHNSVGVERKHGSFEDLYGADH